MKKILLVEDDKAIIKMMRRRMKRAGYEIHVAENGREGLEKVKTVQPDLILMDMHMPEMDGNETTQILRKQGYKGLICAVTASAASKDAAESMKSGCDHFISKPIDYDFEKKIEAILAGGCNAENTNCR